MGPVLELVLWMAVLLPLALSAAVRDAWRSAPAVARLTVAMIACGILAVQMIPSLGSSARKTAMFPITPWTMYTIPTRVVSYWELELEHRGGMRTSYPLEWIDRRHVRTALTRLRLEADTAQPADTTEPAGTSDLDASLAHLLRMYNRRRPDFPASAIVLTARRQPLKEFTEPDRVPSSIVARITQEQADATR